MSAHPALSVLSEQFADIITMRDEIRFTQLFDTLAAHPSFDDVVGGLFDHSAPAQKHLGDNTAMAAICTLAANVFSVPECAKAAVTTLNNIAQQQQLENGFYSDSANYNDTDIEVSDLITLLDPAQWLALKTRFRLPDDGRFHWHTLTRHIAVQQLADKTGLHPKQAPWALEGGIQLMQHLIKQPSVTPSYSISNNILFCYGLLLSATYLNQSQHADIALSLMTRINEEITEQHRKLWQLLLVQRLAYHWDDSDFNALMQMEHDSDSSFVVNALMVLCQNQQAAQRSSITSSPLKHELLFVNLLNQCERIVLIEGPAYEAREWLQLSNNHYNPTTWIFARPAEQPCRARMLDKNANLKSIDSIDELLKLVSAGSGSLP